ncbi:MAG: hypothetical protein K8R40_13810 [Anaerolineaceae bacterium]|nr:hypothetical protein [Anaerolineaceae bacterium]
MFKIPSINVIESDEGFSVEVIDRSEVLYTEGCQKFSISAEMIAGPSGLVLYKNSIESWDSSPDNRVIDKEKRNIIIDNIRRAFRFRGIEIQVI